jgi:transmembrane sensor
MQKNAIRQLIEQYLNGQLTDDQGQELLELINTGDEAEVLAVLKELMQEESLQATALDAETLRASLQKVLAVDRGLPPAPPVRRLVARRRWWAAAAILVVLGTGSWLAFFNKRGQPIATVQTQAGRFKNDVAPGGNKAILTLAGGKQIVLDSAADGVLTQQGNAQVRKSANGQLSYSIVTERPTTVLYNTLSTPRGGVYQLVLPDGSNVWLNSESSIKYPVFFTGGERKVEIKGEVYFEVVKNASQPFKVIAGRQEEVDVLGTSFDINGYDDEPVIKTTLLDGSVRVTAPNQDKLSFVLKPGQQAQLQDGNGGNGTPGGGAQMKVLKDVDVNAVVAWKNGQFRFKGADLGTVMRQIARWYDVDVKYEGRLPDYPLVGTIPRNVPVSEILKLLELTGEVHFAIDGKQVTVMPYSK